MSEIFGLFPVPFMRTQGALNSELVGGLIAYFSARTTCDNNSSQRLTHTQMWRSAENPLLSAAAAQIAPALVEFGTHLFGERLEWMLKEMWVNVLEHGGHQA